MKKVARFGVVDAQREPEPRIRLRDDERGESVEINAVSLLAQYETSLGDVILMLDEDCPYEEQLHIVLLRGGQIIDHLLIGGWYATGNFEEVSTEGDVVRFRFGDERVLRLDVLREGSRSPGHLAGGARRQGGWLKPHFLRLTAASESPRPPGICPTRDALQTRSL